MMSASSGAAGSPNLYLVGFMGTGKSTVGRVVAARLGMSFVDSDSVIEERAGKPIGRIFEEDGEDVFRRYEREFVESGHAPAGCVVSCGGGLVLQDVIIEQLRKSGVVICLTARPETILERTAGNKNRPLLNVEDPLGRIREILAQRAPIYRRLGTEVLTDGRPVPEIAAHVQRVYRREARPSSGRNR